MTDLNFKDIAASIPGVLYRFRMSTNFTMSFDYMSDYAQTLFGESADELIKKGLDISRIHPDDQKKFMESIMFSADTQTRWRWIGRYFRDEKRMIWIEGISSPTKEVNGDIVWNGFMWDVTERKLLEQLMVDEKNQLEMIASGVSLEKVLKNICLSIESLLIEIRCAIFIVDDDKLRWMAAPSLPLNFKPLVDGQIISDSTGSSGAAVFWDADIVIEDIQKTLPESEMKNEIVKSEILASWSRPIHASSGEVIGVFASYFPTARKPREDEKIAIERATHLASIAIEKTMVSRKVEEQRALMVSSARLSTLGEMAAGVAHEINNPLAIIFGNASNLVEMVDENTLDVEKIKKSADKILKTSERIARITKGLKTISRDGSNDPFTSNSFKTIVSDAVEFCITRFRHHDVKLQICDIDEDLKVCCRSVQISQVVLNLLNNAFDAVCDKPEPWVDLQISVNPKMLEVWITDSGHGIPDQVAEKIMLPFFTTKEVGKGTGLGLSIVNSIIKEHKGDFYLDTKCANTRFVFTIPLAEA